MAKDKKAILKGFMKKFVKKAKGKGGEGECEEAEGKEEGEEEKEGKGGLSKKYKNLKK